MVYKRNIKKGDKISGPYYYHNIKTKNGEVKTIYLGTKKPSPLKWPHIIIICFFFIIIAGGVLFLSQIKIIEYPKSLEESKITTDQLLIKFLLKQGDSIKKDLSIMNTGDSLENIKILTEGLGGLIYVRENSFELLPGQTKKLDIDIITKEPTKKIIYSPDIYIGKLYIESEKEYVIIPVIIEIESKDVLFDMNINLDAQDRIIELGDSKNIEIRLFNLGRVAPANVLMEYNTKSLNGETIFTETETVVISNQASFFKTIKIPSNLNTGEYVFTAKAKYGTSLGTSSYLFEVKAKEIKKSGIYYENISNFLYVCSNTPYCWITLIALIIFIFILGSYAYFFIGAYIYSRINKNFLHEPTYDFKLKRMHKEHPLEHHIVWPFILIAILLSLGTAGVLYYEQLFPKIIVYFSQLKLSEYMEIIPDITLYFNLIIGGLIILLTLLLILRYLLKEK